MKTTRLTTKTKKEIRHFSSLLLMLLATMCLLAFLTSCSKPEVLRKNRSTPATVRHLRSPDGGGFVFEPRNGENTEPFFTPMLCGNGTFVIASPPAILSCQTKGEC